MRFQDGANGRLVTVFHLFGLYFFDRCVISHLRLYSKIVEKGFSGHVWVLG